MLGKLERDAMSKELEVFRNENVPGNFNKALMTEEEFLKIKYDPKIPIVEGLIYTKSIILISGPPGCGKTWFGLSIANLAVGAGSFGSWNVGECVNTMYIDGELPGDELQESIRLLRHVAGRHKHLFIISSEASHLAGSDSMNLSDPRFTNFIYDTVMGYDIKLLIIDNLASLTRGMDENLKNEFDPINEWLVKLRNSGVTTVILHHTNKTGGQRGTSSHIDNSDISLVLNPIKTKDGSCKFRIEIEKDRRNVMKGKCPTLHLISLADPIDVMEGIEDDNLLLVEETDRKKSFFEPEQSENPDEDTLTERCKKFILDHQNRGENVTYKMATEAGFGKHVFYNARADIMSFGG